MSKGSVLERGPETWLLKYDAKPESGRRRQRYAWFKGTKKDARIKLRELMSAVDKGQDVDPSKETVAELVERWFRDWAEGERSGKTNERDREIVRLHIVPRIGALRAQQLRESHLQTLYVTLRRPKTDGGAGLAGRTVKHVHRILHRALKVAGKGRIAVNPAAEVEKPKAPKTKIEILSEVQVKEVLSALRGRVLYLPVAVALATGLRRGELLALRWDDVDLDAQTLRVDEAIEETKAGLTFKAPKTEDGRRLISLPGSLVAELRTHRESQLRAWVGLRRAALPDNAAVLDRLPPETLIFGLFDPATGSYKPRRPRGFSHQWAEAVHSLKLPDVTLHALRHTHASQVIAAKVDIVTLSRRMGHADPAITLRIYGHLFKIDDTSAADAVDGLFRATGI